LSRQVYGCGAAAFIDIDEGPTGHASAIACDEKHGTGWRGRAADSDRQQWLAHSDRSFRPRINNIVVISTTRKKRAAAWRGDRRQHAQQLVMYSRLRMLEAKNFRNRSWAVEVDKVLDTAEQTDD
jgi:hypothetical protein